MTMPIDELRITSKLLTTTISRLIEKQLVETTGGGLRIDLQSIHAAVNGLDARVRVSADARIDSDTLNRLVFTDKIAPLKHGAKLFTKMINAALTQQMLSERILDFAKNIIEKKTGISVTIQLHSFSAAMNNALMQIHIDAEGIMDKDAFENLMANLISK